MDTLKRTIAKSGLLASPFNCRGWLPGNDFGGPGTAEHRENADAALHVAEDG